MQHKTEPNEKSEKKSGQVVGLKKQEAGGD